MTNPFNYPLDANNLLRKKGSIRRNLMNREDFMEKRIAILGGSTTAEIKDMIELFLLNDGIRPVFYESEYNRYFEEIMFPPTSLKGFKPDLIYIHTSSVNITRYPAVAESGGEIEKLISSEVERFKGLWDRITADYSCPIIQNNFELPHYRSLGNLDGYDVHGRSCFVAELNLRFSQEARQRQNLHLNDINYLAAWFGLERWYDKIFWYSYKYAMSYEAIPLLANSVAAIAKAIFGKTKKCLVLDLDNTLWGGVIGDDGLTGIRIGKETPEAEAYTEFQHYVKGLKDQGVILAVCSKNDDANAREGFGHPDSVLALTDFSAFRANWEPKHQNIREIARALNIGIDSVAFVDDDPVERDRVRSQEPQVSVPELGNNVAKFIDIVDKTGFFETVSLTLDDLKRSSFYSDNAVRQEMQKSFENYDDYLRSLCMVAEIKPFAPVYFDRITQLINKTNQFNLTTRRYTLDEVKAIAADDRYLTLYGRLQDKFGDNGLVSVMIGGIKKDGLHIDLWLMSCRVLKRGMESAMLDQFVAAAQAGGIKALMGYYYPSAKNRMVSGLFKEMGFQNTVSKDDGQSIWSLDISAGYTSKNVFIGVNR